jgi:V-type H+-transporting ATPase subunit d
MLSFNIHDGFLEAIVRGNRSGLLTAADYNNLCQCENLDDVKMHLTATEYGPYLQNGTTSLSRRRRPLISFFGGIGSDWVAPP